MPEVDDFASLLLEEAKRFLEKAVSEPVGDAKEAYLHGALLLGFASFEAHLNSMAADFLVLSDLSPLDRSILSESDIQLDDGEFVVTARLKMYRLEDRIQFIHRRFSGSPLDRSSPVWSAFKAGLQLRNQLTHPKEPAPISEAAVAQAIEAIVALIDQLYQSVYRKGYPAARRGLNSSMTF